jgi:carbonic anhydrase
MKRYILICIVFTSFVAMAQEKRVVWDYPVKPGTEKWNLLKTEKERIDAVQVPENILRGLSSEDIVKICISFPSFGYFTAYNTSQEGFLVMKARFNIFNICCQKKTLEMI